MPRLPYLNREDLPEEFRDYFDSLRTPEGKMLNLHRIMAYRPNLIKPRIAFSSSLVRNQTLLTPRVRELALLTVGRVTKGLYEFHHHLERALEAGLTEEHIMVLPLWESHPIFTNQDRAVIRYTEEMTINIRVADATFDALRSFLSKAEIVELTLVIAHYNSTVRFLEALQVLPDEEGGL